jgi:hypothetical protein
VASVHPSRPFETHILGIHAGVFARETKSASIPMEYHATF